MCCSGKAFQVEADQKFALRWEVEHVSCGGLFGTRSSDGGCL